MESTEDKSCYLRIYQATPSSATRSVRRLTGLEAVGEGVICLINLDEKLQLLVKTNKVARTCSIGDLMVERSAVKITVLKKTDSKQIFGDSSPMGQAMEACSRFKEGQEFIVEEDGLMPEGFCTWAWDDLYKAVTTLRFGGDFPWMKEKGTGVFCCTDGFRPVIFELRRTK